MNGRTLSRTELRNAKVTGAAAMILAGGLGWAAWSHNYAWTGICGFLFVVAMSGVLDHFA